jgi:hypothetical protein
MRAGHRCIVRVGCGVVNEIVALRYCGETVFGYLLSQDEDGNIELRGDSSEILCLSKEQYEMEGVVVYPRAHLNLRCQVVRIAV